MYQHSKHEPCYYCGAPPPSTKEHAPPKMMFKGFNCGSLTVPSCDAHNSGKGNTDHAIVTMLLMALQQVLIHQEPKPALAPNVRKAIQIAAPNFGQDKALVTLQAFVLDASPDLGYPLPYFNNQNELKHWVRQLTAALTWSVIGQYEPAISWDNVIVWSPQFIPTDTALSQEEAINRILEKKRLKENLDDIDWLQGWSPHPPWPQDIYRLGVTFLPVEDTDEEIAVIFHHTFYNSLNWYVWVDMPYKIAEQLFVVCKPIDKESA